jgi:4-hydroxythreonine-4-phosphate dehydrogenase
MSNNKLKIGITLGDVNGVGPEIVVRALLDARFRDMFTPILYGSSRVINIYRKILDINKFHFSIVPSPSQAFYNKINLIECNPELEQVEVGVASEAGGRAAQQSLLRAVEDAQHQAIDALITMPVDKATFQLVDPDFVGHTELLGKAFNVEENLMLMVADQLRVGLVTNHLALQDVSRNLSREQILRKARLLHQSLRQDFGIGKPMIAVLGLNPHAGDQGLLGKEEKEVILPALEELKAEGIFAMGPYPADGLFGSMAYQKFDGILAMYHDQGLIPFKLIAGYQGVNYTAGIPLIRTSPDHGVAYDIAGKGVADVSSLQQSVFLTIDIHRNRIMQAELEANPLKVHEGPRKKRGQQERRFS